eukprot:COSAG02_NODE_5167_length_4576_cov_8.229171_5_plen_114_part_01
MVRGSSVNAADLPVRPLWSGIVSIAASWRHVARAVSIYSSTATVLYIDVFVCIIALCARARVRARAWRSCVVAGPSKTGCCCYGTRTTVRQIPEVRARAAARGPARSSQPGHIE